MKNFFKGKSFNFFGVKLDKSVLYGVLALIALLISYPKIKQLINDYQNQQALKNATNNIANNNQSTADPVHGVRSLMIKGWADSLHSYLSGFWSFISHTTDTFPILKSLNNVEEVTALSAYYQNTYSTSLLGVIQADCGKFAAVNKFDSLPDFVKNSLY